MNIDRITVTIDVDTTKVRSRAIEDALVEILSQWQADDRIVDCDICIDEVKNDSAQRPAAPDQPDFDEG